MSSARKMLVTTALPYANGHLHLGHLVEHIQADLWVRLHKMMGHSCLFICGDDAHGTPIMLKAEALNTKPEDLIAAMKESHEEDFRAFSIDYDSYHSTHSPENEGLAQAIYKTLERKGYIVKKTIHQAFDPIRSMFLPDRYVKGTCPKCFAPEQYGDNCENCGASYSPMELIEPFSVISGTKPIEKASEHLFFDLPRQADFLQAWIKEGVLQKEMANKLEEWFESGLKLWDISRDAPYFGFKIPGCEDKYFYVWLDAPIGYMASFKKYCKEKNVDFDEYWSKQSKTELFHFVGKDILYFHALFWPAVLEAAEYRLPTAIFTHGFLTVNGQKMSKSRGTFIEAKTYLRHLDPACLRYYFAAKLNGRVEDLDLNLDDFVARINADLVGKIVNIASRCAGFIDKFFDKRLAKKLHDPELFASLLAPKETILNAYIERDSASAIREIMALADLVNQYIDHHKPWALAKTSPGAVEIQEIATMGLNAFRLLMTYLKPVLPEMAEKVEAFLNCDPLLWDTMSEPLLDKPILSYQALITRIDKAQITALLSELQERTGA